MGGTRFLYQMVLNPLNAELNPICHLLALLGAHHILHVSRVRVKIDHSDLKFCRFPQSLQDIPE